MCLGAMSDPSLFPAALAGGASDLAILLWLARVVLRQQRRLDIMQTHIRYLRREAAYQRGFAEPEDNGDDCGGE